MTREEKVMQIMRLRNLSEVEAVVSVESDVDLNEESLAQYNKVRQCKEKALEALARTLKVSPNTFKGCDTDDVIALMETIFWIEANGENEVKVVDGKIILDIPSLYPYLENYRIMKKAAELDMISNQSYIDWKLNWNKNTIPVS